MFCVLPIQKQPDLIKAQKYWKLGLILICVYYNNVFLILRPKFKNTKNISTMNIQSDKEINAQVERNVIVSYIIYWYKCILY